MALNVSGISKIERIEDEGMFYLETPSENTKYNLKHDYEEGWYDKTYESKDHVFLAGTYGTYSQFRNILSLSALGCSAEDVWDNEDKFKGAPFIELINFTDCEGFLGAKIANKLYEDFKKHSFSFGRYVWKNVDDVMMRETLVIKYDNWIKALRVAKDDGIIMFN